MAAPTHAELAGYLRCLIYDLNVLAASTEAMIRATDDRMIEVYKTAALVKLRAVYDFFHRRQASDSIKIAMFQVYAPVIPAPQTTTWDPSLTHQSINTYVVHLDIHRVTKNVPQPKFKQGETAILRTAVELMADAKEFVDCVVNHADFAGLNELGIQWRSEFEQGLRRLREQTNGKS